jgi:hypothetical protein
MANLRIIEIKVFDSTTIRAKFTESLDPIINTANVEIIANTPGIPNPKVLTVSVKQNVLTIITRPLTPYAAYFVNFHSTDDFKFKSTHGSFLTEDGTTNVPLILGPEDPADPIRNFLIDYQKFNVYNIDNGTLVRDIINSQSDNLSQALHDIGRLKNDNYLTIVIEDEAKIRSSGPFDRLNEEGAYEVVRVGKRRAGANLTTSQNYNSFPPGPITLQSIPVTEEKLIAGVGASTFNGLILTVSKRFVTKLLHVRIAYQNGTSSIYDISSFGYQIKEPRYDQRFASPLLTLNDDQFKLSDAILNSNFILPKAGDFIFVDYEYQNLGRIIDSDSVMVSQVLDAVREVTPPIKTQFSLKHAPIVTGNDILATTGGVIFLDPNANPPFSAIHQAFTKEIPFKFDGLPTSFGEYAIDYQTGTVYTYGVNTNDGTGDYPPVATYKYRKSFASRLDYTYDPDFQEVVANPSRDLIGQKAKITFDYEEVLTPGIDYNPQVHLEILDERIENRLIASNVLTTLSSPITDVFRVFNETSGEIYKVTRWNGNKVYFSAVNPPRILDQNRERASFTDVVNELLIVNQELSNSSDIRIYQILLSNNRIISASEDAIGSSYNSSAIFSRNDIFVHELYFDSQTSTLAQNINRIEIGKYQIDYGNGIIYIGVSNEQNFDIGTVNYKKSTVAPQNSHLIAVSEIYHSISIVDGINKRIGYTEIGEGFVQPSSFDITDERFLNGDTTLPYIVNNQSILLSDDIKEVRGIFDHYDLTHNDIPTNFSEGIDDIVANVITLSSTGILKQNTLTVQIGNEINVPFISNGAEISEVISVIRISDGIDLWAIPGSFSNYQILLTSGTVGDVVFVTYRVVLNGNATPIVDYNRGDYFIDYSFLADEILVSYEYGDNNLDFRESDALSAGDEYFVTYKAGALRDSLLKNFGTLVNLPILNSFDTSLSREAYRDSLKAALQSFTKGPTIPAMKSIVSNITHIDPELEEAAFQSWSLGISRLYPSKIKTSGDVQLMTGKFDLGVLSTSPGQTITFPISSNLRLEEGTLEMWVIPEWDGLDNDATLTFDLREDGYLISADKVFIGADSHHPIYDKDNQFAVSRFDSSSPIGLPSAIFTQTGIFIFYDDVEKQWKIYAKDRVTSDKIYSGSVSSSGEVYDAKFLPGLGEVNDILRSGVSKIEFEFNIDAYDSVSPDGYVDGYQDGYFPADGYVAGFSYDGIRFKADNKHYLFDFGKTHNTNRFSIFKDGKGYLNFHVYDKGRKNKRRYEVTADISNWKAGQKHHVGVTWILNSSNRRDEMHLFIDGMEVPNIMRYGGRPAGTSTDRFRIIKPEYVAGLVPKRAIAGNDLRTLAGSNIVVSSTNNFQALGIVAGDDIFIDESGFSAYSVVAVSGYSLILDSVMPTTLNDARYSVNRYSVVVSSEIDLYSNIVVSVLRNGIEIELPGIRAEIPGYAISKNAFNQNVLTILGNTESGDQIIIRTLGLNHRRSRDRQYVWGNTSNVIKTQLPPPINLDEVKIVAVPLPFVSITPSNSTYILGQFHATFFPTQPSNNLEGRTLSVRVSGGNVRFSPTQPTVTIHGTTAAGPTSEVLSFDKAKSLSTVNKFKTISSVDVVVTPVVSTAASIGVEIKEAYSITNPDGNNNYPVIRFSYKSNNGTTLSGTAGTSTVIDVNNNFLQSSVGQILVINSPASVAGSYSITGYINGNTLSISPSLPASFTNGIFDIFNVSIGRSGFQNGFFVLEEAGSNGDPFPLNQGFYDFDFSSYLEIPFEPVNDLQAYVGSDIDGNNQAKAVLDELRILSKKLTDVRIGETLGDNQDSITTDYTALRAFEADSNTLMLLHFDSESFVNSANFWTLANKEFLQAGESVNDNFGQSLVVIDKPLVVDNNGLLSTVSEGSIEFWISPRFDTYNDPDIRFYFDATGTIVEESVSLTNGIVKTNGRISSVLSVRLQTDKDNTGVDYFEGGSISTDFQTIRLKKALPSQQTPVKINYIPSGLSGDRISIFKDREGFIVFNVRAKGIDYQLRQAIFWQRDSWHRIQATYKFNRADNKDELRLFIDGEEKGTILFGSGILFGQVVFGQSSSTVQNSLISDINFKDPINEFFIGSDYFRTNTANARIDNLRLSNIARRPLSVAGQPTDINFSSNISTVFPVVEDAFTTYLLNFDSLLTKVTDFTILRDERFGIFDFTLNIIDSFGIVSGSAKIKQVLESLIAALKPAQSRATINYIK